MVKVVEENNNLFIKNCMKCDKKIGGKSYYLAQFNCLYDGENISHCDNIILCSKCYKSLNHWLKNEKK